MDDYAQPDAPDEFFQPPTTTHPVNIWRKRSTKGNRPAQSARYYVRHKTARALYMRRYMASRRAAQRNPSP